ATAASGRGAWEAAAVHATQAALRYEFLAAADVYEPTPDAATASALNARGIKQLSPDQDADDRSARDLFLEAARLSPANLWLHLNASFALAAASGWDDASRELSGIAATVPRWLRSPLFEAWSADFSLRHVEALIQQGRGADARAALHRTAATIDACVA